MIKLVKYEMQKILLRKSVWVLIIVTLTFIGFTYYYKNHQYEDQRHINKMFYSQFEGKVTSRKINNYEKIKKDLIRDCNKNKYLIEDIKKIDKIIKWKKSKSLLIYKLNEKIKHLNLTHEHGYNYRNLIKKKEMLKKLKTPQIHMDRGWILFLGSLSSEFFSLLIIIIGLSPMFSSEYSLNTSSLILTSKHGKGTLVFSKIIAGIIYSSLIYLIFSVFLIVNNVNTNVLKGWNSPIQGISNLSWYNQGSFEHSPYSLTVFQYLINFLLVRLIGCMMISVLIMFFSCLFKSATSVFFTSTLIIFSPAIFMQFTRSEIMRKIYSFSFYSLFSPSHNFKSYYTHNVFGIPILHLNLLITSYILLSLALIYCIYQVINRKQVC